MTDTLETETQTDEDAAVDAALATAKGELDDLIADRARHRATAGKRLKKPRHRAHASLPEFRRAAGGIEVRRYEFVNLEVRSAAGDSSGDTVELTGAPIVYDQAYEVYDMFGAFEETMHPGVASQVLSSRELDCRFLINHKGLPLGRTTSGTLTLTDTADALTFSLAVDMRQQMANDLVVAIERKDVTQMSCGFIVAADTWNDDYTVRDIYALDELLDVSAVTYPASPTTTIDIANRMLMEVPVESRARVKQLWSFATELRGGKVLSKENADHIVTAAKALMAVAENAGVDLEDTDDDTATDADAGPQGDLVTPITSGQGGSDGTGSRSDEAPVEERATLSEDDLLAIRSLIDSERRAITSFSDIESAVQQALLDEFGDGDGDFDLWVVDCSTDGVGTFRSYVDPPGNGTYQVQYTLDGDGIATLAAGDPVEVVAQTNYVPVDSSKGAGTQNNDAADETQTNADEALVEERDDADAEKRMKKAAGRAASLELELELERSRRRRG